MLDYKTSPLSTSGLLRHSRSHQHRLAAPRTFRITSILPIQCVTDVCSPIHTEPAMAIPLMKPTESPKQTRSTHLPTVGSIMSRHVVTATMDDTLATIQELFKEHRFHHLLVVEQRKLVGVISDRDLLKAISPNIGTLSETDRDRATLNKRAHQIMSRNPIAATAITPIEAAAKLMIEKKVSCLPITTEENTLVGILSWKDIMKALLASTASVS